MRILYIFPEEFPDNKARCIQVAKSINALALNGIEVFFVYSPNNYYINEPFKFFGIRPAESLKFIPISRKLLNIKSHKFFMIRFKKFFKEEIKFVDCIISRHLKIAYQLLLNFPKIPIIYEAHEVFADSAPKERVHKISELEKIILTKASLVIANSQGTANRFRERYKLNREIFVIPNGVDVIESQVIKPWNEIQKNIVYAGSLLDWKGIEDLIASAQYLKGCKIFIIGGGKSQIEKLKRGLKPEGAEVEFLGYLTHEKTIQFLKNSCIAVLPNKKDNINNFTSPLKLFEYMAAGCAIVASRIPSIQEILEDEDAEWFEAGDPLSLSEAIKKLVSNPNRAKNLGERVKEKSTKYNWNNRALRILNLINERILK